MDVAGDSVALFVGRSDAQALEQAGVVDGNTERFGEAVKDLDVLGPEMGGLKRFERNDSDDRTAGA